MAVCNDLQENNYHDEVTEQVTKPLQSNLYQAVNLEEWRLFGTD